MKIKEKFLKIIKNSKLEKKDKDLWEVFCKNTNDKQVAEILKVIELSSEDLIFITNNLKEKLVAFYLKDKELLNKILKEEKNYIKSK